MKKVTRFTNIVKLKVLFLLYKVFPTFGNKYIRKNISFYFNSMSDDILISLMKNTFDTADMGAFVKEEEFTDEASIKDIHFFLDGIIDVFLKDEDLLNHICGFSKNVIRNILKMSLTYDRYVKIFDAAFVSFGGVLPTKGLNSINSCWHYYMRDNIRPLKKGIGGQTGCFKRTEHDKIFDGNMRRYADKYKNSVEDIVLTIMDEEFVGLIAKGISAKYILDSAKIDKDLYEVLKNPDLICEVIIDYAISHYVDQDEVTNSIDAIRKMESVIKEREEGNEQHKQLQ